MAIREILRMGHPVLRQQAAAVTGFDTPELHALLQDMHDTMEAANGAGLAAPQIGVSLQVVVFGVRSNPRYPDAEQVPYTVLINPRIEALDEVIEQQVDRGEDAERQRRLHLAARVG